MMRREVARVMLQKVLVGEKGVVGGEGWNLR